MQQSKVGPLVDLVRQLYGEQLRAEIDCPSALSFNFIIGTSAGLLGIQIDCVEDGEGLKSLLVSVMPLILGSDKRIGFYDLCNIDLAGYEMIDEIRRKLDWGSLDLDCEDGTKSPMLCRAEVLDPTRSLADQDLARIGTVLQMLEMDAVQVVPILAAISSGAPITREGIALAMTEVHASVQ